MNPAIWKARYFFPVNFAPAKGTFDAFEHGLTRSARLTVSPRKFWWWIMQLWFKARKLGFSLSYFRKCSWERRHCILMTQFLFSNLALRHLCKNLNLPCACPSNFEKYTHYYYYYCHYYYPGFLLRLHTLKASDPVSRPDTTKTSFSLCRHFIKDIF